jgi:hypothetical protein
MMMATKTKATDVADTAVWALTDVRIVVLPRGWVVVGEYAEAAGKVTVSRGAVIRRWGTTDGLGQLASGPRSATKLDALGTLECAAEAVIFTVRCEAEGWEKALPR